MKRQIEITRLLNDSTVLPVEGWKRIHFIVAIRRNSRETISDPLPGHRRISEAHAVRTAIAVFGQSSRALRPGNHSCASVRFHTTAITED